MLTHAQVWSAIDRLAARAGLSASGLARRAGLDPENLPVSNPSAMNFAEKRDAKPWGDIWGSGQGIGAVREVGSAGELVARLGREYATALHRLGASGQTRGRPMTPRYAQAAKLPAAIAMPGA